MSTVTKAYMPTPHAKKTLLQTSLLHQIQVIIMSYKQSTRIPPCQLQNNLQILFVGIAPSPSKEKTEREGLPVINPVHCITAVRSFHPEHQNQAPLERKKKTPVTTTTKIQYIIIQKKVGALKFI